MTATVALLGAVFAVGCWLVTSGLRSPDPTIAPAAESATLPLRRESIGRWRPRMIRAAVAAAVVLVATRWPTATIAAGLIGWWSPELFATGTSRDRGLARTEAIATWTEMLRDTISSAHGLEAAITTTAPIAPEAIRGEVQHLARSLRHSSLSVGLRQLAVDLAHPISDLVVASLTVAASGAVRDLSDLLGMLAESARDEAAMQMRVEASRARMRTAVRVIAVVTIATAVGLVVLNPSYVAVYSTTVGQVVLAAIAAVWAAALWWLASMSRFQTPERFLIATIEQDPTR